jgi:hypothetical protein
LPGVYLPAIHVRDASSGIDLRLILLTRAENVGDVMLSDAKHVAAFAGRFLAALGMTTFNVFRSR